MVLILTRGNGCSKMYYNKSVWHMPSSYLLNMHTHNNIYEVKKQLEIFNNFVVHTISVYKHVNPTQLVHDQDQ